MNNDDRIKSIQIEDFIFIIYYIIITLSLYSNKIEKEYLYSLDRRKKTQYRTLLFIIFGIAFLVYLYYFSSNLKDLNHCHTKEAKKLNELSMVASLLVLISGIIYLYIILQDEDISVELAFN